MNDRQKEVVLSQLDDEKKVINDLKKIYKASLEEIDNKVAQLLGRTDTENLQSIVYQLDYQKALRQQIGGILDNLNGEQFTTISEYLQKSYESGFIGNMYDLHGQGIPLIIPMNEKEIIDALQNDTKLSEGLYKKLGENTDNLKKSISQNISRGIAQGLGYVDIAQNITYEMVGNYSTFKGGAIGKSCVISRTEGHRINQQAANDAQHKAKENGAKISKQWDAALDSRTRDSHAKVDGEIRELDERFSNGLLYPGDKNGTAGEVVNCRCVATQRTKWALDAEELDLLKQRAEVFGLDKSDSFDDFKKKYIKSTTQLQNETKSGIISNTRETLKIAQVEYRAVQPFKTTLSESEIIDRLGGGDLTIGSCSSLAFAYSGNKSKLDVLDFRGGISQSTFSSDAAINEIAGLPGVKGTVLKKYNDFTAAKKLLKTVESGKEYYFGVGQHAAIIRKTQRGYEYLELQSATSNGFKPLTTDVLKYRFGCKKSHTYAGNKMTTSSQLIECESLGGSDEFKELLGYINTSETDQMKGVKGSVK